MIRSTKARKQRKWVFNAPLHRRQKIMAAPLAKKLQKDFDRRSLPVRVGDKVEVTRGDFKGTKGKIVSVDLKGYKIEVDSVKRKASNGTEVKYPIHTSNVIITDPVMSDKRRVKIIERSGGKVTVTEEKPKAEKKTEKKEAAKKAEEGEEKPAETKENAPSKGKGEYKDYV